ncbi:uncharacterized protein LOC119327686 isoform X1 [Triticum dicoccoides]|uniref:uncharacterized protein LOC119327686 isoform X1 n=1 Tax=Triticum dicoccoides TaxID=85692 RepID=UPI00188FF3FB|nr:uncharacterized protein LOC119327686 isoform X1 [Triticum dicoccoides]
MGNSCVTGSSSTSNHGQSLKSNGEKASDNSCVTGSCLSNQGQSQESNGSETTFKWRIDGFSSLLDKGWTSSSVFNIRGFDWYMVLNLRDRKSGDKNEYVSLELVLFLAPEILHTVVEASFKFLIYDQSYGKHLEQHQVSQNFQAPSRVSGTSFMIPLATLKEQSSGFLVEDSCVFGIQFIKVVPVKGSSKHRQNLKANVARAIGNSCVTGSSQSSQGHCQESNGSETTFKWRIDGFSSLLDKGEGWTNSSVFNIRGFNWYLMLNPRDRKSGDKNEYVSLKLVLTQTVSERSHLIAKATFKFLIYDQSYGKHHEEHQVSHNFQAASRVSGISCMIPLAKLKEQSSGFLVKDSCVFGIQFIKVVAVKGNDVSETLFVQKISNICSDPQVYTWNIDDFFVLKNPSTSPEFDQLITIYPSGSDKNPNYLSLYLNMKDSLHKDSAILADVSITIKDQETGKHKKLSARLQLKNCAPTWGWGKFISLEDFKDSSQGYLVKTKCCIEAQIAVIGSSKTE